MANNEFVKEIADKKYEYGFTTDIHTEIIEQGLNEDIIRLISAKKQERVAARLPTQAYRHWLTLEQPDWGHVALPEIDYQPFVLCRPYEKTKGRG